MYGSESWVLNVTLLKRLESFQAEIGKRILQLPKYTSNSVPLLVLRWPLMYARILCSKMSLLFKICNDEDGSSLRAQTFTAIAATDVNSLSIVKQCRFLQSNFPSLSVLTDEALCKSHTLSLRSLKEKKLKADRTRTMVSSAEHSSLLYTLKIAKQMDETMGSVPRSWSKWHQSSSLGCP